MGIYFNPNHTDFYNAVNHSQIYIDKTELIQYTNFVLFGEQKYICVSRPRRFGQSMAANMLTAYYSRGCDSRELFQGLKIATHPDFEKHLNQYNVIHLNMRDYLTESENIQQLIQFIEEDLLDELQQEFSDIRMPRRKTLVKVLEQAFIQYEIPFVFIIDEWDCIFRVHKSDVTSQTAYLDFLRNLLKDKSYVALAYMTGILPIKKYGEHSAINVFYEYSMTDASPIEKFTGFTEQEVRQLCEQYKMPFSETKKWYDGYCVDGVSIYNPKSVVEAMMRGKFNNYWTKTETYEALRDYIDMNFDGLKDAVVNMLGGAACEVDTGSFQNDMTSMKSKDDVLTFLIHLGYLAYNQKLKVAFIPNEEIREEFLAAVKRKKWNELVDFQRASKALLNATLDMDAEAVAKYVEKIHQEYASVIQYNDENSLSSVLAIAYLSAMEYYFKPIRELPTGRGFADFVFLPKAEYAEGYPALLVELKWNQSAEAALAQIKEKKYPESLVQYTGNILLVGINYDKKNKKHQCLIEEMKK